MDEIAKLVSEAGRLIGVVEVPMSPSPITAPADMLENVIFVALLKAANAEAVIAPADLRVNVPPPITPPMFIVLPSAAAELSIVRVGACTYPLVVMGPLVVTDKMPDTCAPDNCSTAAGLELDVFAM